MSIRTPQSGIESPSNDIGHSRVKAAIWGYGGRVREFCEELDPRWQAKIIAHYILDNQITAVLQQDMEKKNRRKNKPSGPIGNSRPPSLED